MTTVLISGASVAGATLAHWLHRYGFDVTLVERAAAPREGGYAVDVRGPALGVLARMGVESAVRSFNCDTLGTSFLAASGKRAASMPRGFGVIDPDDIEIMRGDLVRVLYATTARQLNYQFADSITAIEQRTDRVCVSFEHAQPRSFDLVIGADGLHSNVRQHCFGDEMQFIHHLGSYMAIFTMPNQLGLDRWQYVFNEPRRVVSVKSTTGNRELKVTVFFAASRADYDHRDIALQKRWTATAFANSGWELPLLMRAMHDASDFYFDSTSQVRMPHWSQGRVALVGDAAACPSPLAGQGSSMALVGAYVLAGELAAARGDHAAAFANYERLTRGFMEQNQRVSRDLAAGFAPKSTFSIWARNRSLELLRILPGSDFLLKLAMRDLFKAANGIELRDYRHLEQREPANFESAIASAS